MTYCCWVIVSMFIIDTRFQKRTWRNKWTNGHKSAGMSRGTAVLQHQALRTYLSITKYLLCWAHWIKSSSPLADVVLEPGPKITADPTWSFNIPMIELRPGWKKIVLGSGLKPLMVLCLLFEIVLPNDSALFFWSATGTKKSLLECNTSLCLNCWLSKLNIWQGWNTMMGENDPCLILFYAPTTKPNLRFAR